MTGSMTGSSHGGAGARTVTVLVVDDNAAVRAGLCALLEDRDGIEVVGTAADGDEAVRLVGLLRPAVTLMDVRMPGRDGLSAALAVAGDTRVVMLTSSEEVDIVRKALRLGIAGYLVHGAFDPAQLPVVVRDTAAGGSHMTQGPTAVALAEVGRGATHRRELARAHQLSAREVEVMDAIASGLTNDAVAETLFVAPKTVKNYVNRVFPKLGVRTRGEAIARWLGASAAPTDPRSGALGP